MIENFLKEKGFAMEAVINYYPHHIISNRRQANKKTHWSMLKCQGWWKKKTGWSILERLVMMKTCQKIQPPLHHQVIPSSRTSAALLLWPHRSPLQLVCLEREIRENSQRPWTQIKGTLPKHPRSRILKNWVGWYRLQRIKEKRKLEKSKAQPLKFRSIHLIVSLRMF